MPPALSLGHLLPLLALAYVLGGQVTHVVGKDGFMKHSILCPEPRVAHGGAAQWNRLSRVGVGGGSRPVPARLALTGASLGRYIQGASSPKDMVIIVDV